jgi:hypothetical protein
MLLLSDDYFTGRRAGASRKQVVPVKPKAIALWSWIPRGSRQFPYPALSWKGYILLIKDRNCQFTRVFT